MISYSTICFDLPQCERYEALPASACQDGKEDWFSKEKKYHKYYSFVTQWVI
jgi:hypothetical protein